jgi:hypothetical protein
MTLNNSINANSITPLSTLQGGTGVSSPAANGVLVANGTSPLVSTVMSAGQVLIGTTSSAPVAATLTQGSGITITSASGAITIAANAMSWVDQTSGSVTMAINTGYTTDNGASLVTYTLPTNAVIGSLIEINGKSAGGWSIAQAAS